MKHYWVFRISWENADYLYQQLCIHDNLRQGWGYDPGQNLKNMTVDEGASRNMRMLEVKKGDILLVPKISKWDEVAIVEAKEDWNSGYCYEIDPEIGDFGHIFPAKFMKAFNRHSDIVPGDIRATLHNPSRFWNIDYLSEEVETILKSDKDIALRSQNLDDRFECSVSDAIKKSFDRGKYKTTLYENLIKQFNATEWEFALINGIKKIYPEPYFKVERVGGSSEIYHGTDIIVSFYSKFSRKKYIIAIQVKDYESVVSHDVINQINKADEYWNQDNTSLLEKIVIVTKANRKTNEHLIQSNEGVHFIFAEELKDILYEIGLVFMQDNTEVLS